MPMKLNYDPDGKKLNDYLFEGGISGKVFVNIHDGNKPYIITNRPYLDGPLANLDMSEVWKGGIQKSRGFLFHMDDPEYDPLRVDISTPETQRIDKETLEKALLKIQVEGWKNKFGK